MKIALDLSILLLLGTSLFKVVPTEAATLNRTDHNAFGQLPWLDAPANLLIDLGADVIDFIQQVVFETPCGAPAGIGPIIDRILEGSPFAQIGPFNVTHILKEEIGKILAQNDSLVDDAVTSVTAGGGLLYPHRICPTEGKSLLQFASNNGVKACETLASKYAVDAGIYGSSYFAFGMQHGDNVSLPLHHYDLPRRQHIQLTPFYFYFASLS